MMLVFGVVGYFFKKLKYPLAPLVLALVLGDMAETSFRQSMLLSGGNVDLLVERAGGLDHDARARASCRGRWCRAVLRAAIKKKTSARVALRARLAGCRRSSELLAQRRFCTLPIALRGRSGTKDTRFGTLKLAISPSRADDRRLRQRMPGLATTTAVTASPKSGSGTPMTARLDHASHRRRCAPRSPSGRR